MEYSLIWLLLLYIFIEDSFDYFTSDIFLLIDEGFLSFKLYNRYSNAGDLSLSVLILYEALGVFFSLAELFYRLVRLPLYGEFWFILGNLITIFLESYCLELFLLLSDWRIRVRNNYLLEFFLTNNCSSLIIILFQEILVIYVNKIRN